MRKERIFTPGPTPLMPAAQLAISGPIFHHRTSQFRNLLLSTQSNLKKIFKTKSDLILLSCSGTGAMEAVSSNLILEETQSLIIVIGKFGQRWVQICESTGHNCVVLSKAPGYALGAEEISSELEKHPAVQTLFIQGCETSTATMHDLKTIGKTIRAKFPEVLIVVDGSTAVGSQPIHTDEWGLDVVLSSSQKAFSMSPGLSFISLNGRAQDRLTENYQGLYFNLKQEVTEQREGRTCFTPAISLIQALQAGTNSILDQGIDQVISETEMMARATRAGLRSLNCKILSKSPANAVTAAFPPLDILASQLIERIKDRFGIKLAGGQGSLKGKIFRIAHLGYFDFLDVIAVLGALELVIEELSKRKRDGRSLRAAIATWGK